LIVLRKDLISELKEFPKSDIVLVENLSFCWMGVAVFLRLLIVGKEGSSINSGTAIMSPLLVERVFRLLW